MAKTERLTVELPSHLVAGLRESVRSGAFASQSEAIEELLTAWYGPEGTKEPPIKELPAFVAAGIADVEAGRVSHAEEVYQRVLARIDAFAAAKAK